MINMMCQAGQFPAMPATVAKSEKGKLFMSQDMYVYVNGWRVCNPYILSSNPPVTLRIDVLATTKSGEHYLSPAS